MPKFATQLIRLVALTLLLIPAQAFAAAAGGGEAIVIVADSRRFSGWEAWLANLYNESPFYFTLVTILVIPTMGLVLSKLTGFVMTRIGIDLRSRVLAEH
jgi:hypothetical protein